MANSAFLILMSTRVTKLHCAWRPEWKTVQRPHL